MYADLTIQNRVFDADVSSRAKIVMFALIHHADKNSGIAFPKYEMIGAKVNLCRTSVSGALTELERCGLIKEVARAGRSIHYQLYLEGGLPMTVANSKKLAGKAAASDVQNADVSCVESEHQTSRIQTSDVQNPDIRCPESQHQMSRIPTSDVQNPDIRCPESRHQMFRI